MVPLGVIEANLTQNDTAIADAVQLLLDREKQHTDENLNNVKRRRL